MAVVTKVCESFSMVQLVLLHTYLAKKLVLPETVQQAVGPLMTGDSLECLKAILQVCTIQTHLTYSYVTSIHSSVHVTQNNH